MSSIEFKVMTFNLRLDVPTDPFVWEERKEWAASIIQERKPDLIGTQEATRPMLNWLKDKLGETYDIYGVNRSLDDEVGEFSAVFVNKERFSILREGSFMLSETPNLIGSLGWDAACERICSWVELSLPNEQTPMLRFYNTHLDHIGQVARAEGLHLILNTIDEGNQSAQLPAILTGDFNDTPENGLFDVMGEFSAMTGCFDGWSEAEMKQSKTFHGFEGGTEGAPIDYIFVNGDVEIISTTIVRDRFGSGYPSDHYPVEVLLRLN